jgi:hypothetical protein
VTTDRARFNYHGWTSLHPSRLPGAALLACGFLASSASGQPPPDALTIIERVIARQDPPARQYRALRHLEAQSDKLGGSAWIDAWTAVDPVGGFQYHIIGEGGSGFVRGKVLRPWLDGEKKMWAAGDPERASLSLENYTFLDRGFSADGLAWLDVKSRRKDVLLVDGSIYVNALDGDLVRIEGRLSKTPSFWTRRVEVIRCYQRINGIHMPVSIESVAAVLIAGRSTFKMTYQYETINDQHVGYPALKTPPPPPIGPR